MKDKLATSWEIYNQIVWNPKLNAQAFTVGFADRMSKSGIREKPLLEWASESDIPWHRIRYYRCGGTVVWDRGKRLDLFAQKMLPAEAWAAEINPIVATEVTTDFTLRAIYHFAQNQWETYTGETLNVDAQSLKVITYNVLCDEYEKAYVRSRERYAAIAQYLQNLDADIIALQEATPLLLEYLQQQTWTQTYFLSEAPNHPTLRPFGQVILSKYPFSLVEYKHSPQKRFLVAGWQINNEALHLANVHLTSNRNAKALTVRQEQLAIMVNYLRALKGDILFAGDFNMREAEDVELLKTQAFEDVWLLQHAGKDGFSFNPTENPLAEKFSRSGQPGRFDRIYLRSQKLSWFPKNIELFAQAPIANDYLHASDHYGVLATFDYAGNAQKAPAVTPEVLQQLQTVQPTYQSAIVLIPSKELWQPIQQIRRQYDQKVDRWMPHITLVYGFIPEALFEAALPLLEQALAQLPPFEVLLDEFQYFEHRKSTTAWLRPVAKPNNALQQLQAILQPLFPQCNEQTSRAGGFHPHLSVGQFTSPEEAKKHLPKWKPMNFKAEKIALISRGKDTPFEIKYSLYLGKKTVTNASPLIDWVNQLAPQITHTEQLRRQQALKQLEQVCSKVLNQPIRLQVFGSEQLQVAQASSDIDVLCPIPPLLLSETFFTQLQKALAPVANKIQLVTDARVPALKFTLQGIAFDLLTVQTPFFPAPLQQTKPHDFNQFEELSWQSVVGYIEARHMLKLGTETVSLNLFQDLVRTIRLWAKRKQLTGNAFGFFGNISWAILAAWSCVGFDKKKEVTLENLLKNFFDLLQTHDWLQPIGLQTGKPNYVVRKHRDWMPVVSAFYPYKNTTRNLTYSTAQVIKSEIKKAQQLLQAKAMNWETFFTATDVAQNYRQLLVMELNTKTSQHMEIARGNLTGSLLGVVLGLEQELGAEVRPSVIVQASKDMLNLKLKLGLALPKGSSQSNVNKFVSELVGEFDYEPEAKLRVYLIKGKKD